MAGFGYLGSHQCMDMLQMRHFQRKNSFYLHANTWKLLIPLGSLLLLYALYWLNVDFSFAPWLFCITSFVCAAAIIPYRRFENSYHAYSELLTCLLVENYEILKLDSSQMKQMEVAVDENSYTSEELQYRTKNTGYAFLNELFFRRHKH
ncbi:hypothetical protein LI129_17485, partial [Erysipelatoclostridium ramosum]|nr:hypothetical protein [Thomasclavelia ramosa]